MTKRIPNTFFKAANICSLYTFFSGLTLRPKENPSIDGEYVLISGIQASDNRGQTLSLYGIPQPELIAAWNALAGGVYGRDFSNENAPIGHFEMIHRNDHIWAIKCIAPRPNSQPDWGGITSSWLIGLVEGCEFSARMAVILGSYEGAKISPSQLEYQFPEFSLPRY